MSILAHREKVLVGLLVATGILAIAVLWNVVETVFFAITVAYVLYPARRRLVDRGLSRRIASALITTAAFLAVVVLLAPIVLTLFQRRNSIIALLNDLPEDLPIELFGFVVTIDIGSLVDATAVWLRSLAISLAADAVFIILLLSMFTIVLYGLLLRPQAVGESVFEIAPSEYHDIIMAVHERIAGTLYAIYVIQAATAVITFPIAFVVFYVLGYPDIFILSVI